MGQCHPSLINLLGSLEPRQRFRALMGICNSYCKAGGRELENYLDACGPASLEHEVK